MLPGNDRSMANNDTQVQLTERELLPDPYRPKHQDPSPIAMSPEQMST